MLSLLQQSDSINEELNEFLEWLAAHPALVKSVVYLVILVDILLVLAAFMKREQIKDKIKEHDKIEKLFILSFFSACIVGISALIVMVGTLGLQYAGELPLIELMASVLLLAVTVLLLLCCTAAFLILCVRLFIFMTPAQPHIDEDINWGGTPVLVVFVAFFFVSFLLSFVPGSGTVASVGGSLVFIALPLFLIVKPYQRTLTTAGFKKPVIKILLASIPLIPVLIYGNAVVYEITERIFGQFPLDEIMADIVGESPILMSLQVGVLGPVGEEIFFRGFAYTALKRKYGFKNGILLSSLFFGVYHIVPWQIPYAMVAGLILAYVYEKTQSIYTPIAFHIINNSLAVIELWM
jgi:membrane protease YdiL (CAAX protease family)